MRKIILLFVVALALGQGCASKSNAIADNAVKYPYRAAPEREELIIEGAEKIIVGMPSSEVEDYMGFPDEKNIFFTSAVSMQNHDPDGFCYIYIVERKQPYGTLFERGERIVRLRFDNDGNLLTIEKEGL